MKTYKQLQDKFNKDVEELQKKCKHKKLSKWIEQWWAIGHSTGNYVKVCLRCNKVVKTKQISYLKLNTVTSNSTKNNNIVATN